MECPKCHGKMSRKQRVKKNGKGLEPARYECRCGWAINEATGKGYWPDEESEG
jgi:hypothetical protein